MVLTRRALAPMFAALAVVAAGAAHAQSAQPYTDAAFNTALQSGKPVFVEIHAPWCPTCKQQAPHISRILSDARYKNVAVFKIDYDSQKEALRKLKAPKQSTLIVFKGGKEVDRSVGDTDGQTIKMLMENLL